MSSLGERIRGRRKELGLTQTQLGGGNLTKGFISLVEKGRAKPSLETLLLLAERLQRPVGYFLEPGTLLSTKAVRVAVASAWIAIKQGDYTRAAEHFEEALSLGKESRDKSVEAECHIGLAMALANLRQFDLATESLRRGQELATATGDSRHLVRVSHVLGVIAYLERRLEDARRHFSAGFQRFQATNDPDLSLGGILLYNLGNTYMELGDHVEAARWYEQALALVEATEDLHRLGLVHVQLGVAQRERGDYETAIVHLTKAEHLFEVLQDTRLLGWAHNSLGITLLARGNVDDAIAHINTSLRIKERIGDDPGRARSLTELGRALTMKGAFGEADAALAEADRLTKKFGDTTEAARIQVAWARLRSAARQVAEAVRHYEQAIAAFESLGMDADLATACNELGELLLEQQRPSEAAPYLARTLRVLRADKHH
ncbi:MAG TPA: tetratricopeptide repeat protein [bacterium]|nr:tetratricopeptide repeat protein [bacterium]